MFGNVKTLRELFEIELRYAYDAEKTLVEKGIPSMIESASSPELRSALQAHLGETQTHVARLERVFGALGVKPETKSNEILAKLAAAPKDSTSNIEESSGRGAYCERQHGRALRDGALRHPRIVRQGARTSERRRAPAGDA
jgi:ferritin-like metal-binding protein YciE